MKILKYILLILGLLVSTNFYANNSTEIIKAAAELYNKKEYAEAVAKYESIIQSELKSDKLYYNLGNCYFRLINYPAAILNYERALRLNPNNEDAKINLSIANTRIVDKIEVIPVFFLTAWWNGATSLFSIDQWAIGSIALFILACVLFVLYFISIDYSIKKRYFFGSMILLFVFVVTIFCSIHRKYVINMPEAIIFESSVKIKSAPDFDSSDKFVLHSGTKVLILDHVNGFSKIKIGDGNVGWIEDTEFVKI